MVNEFRARKHCLPFHVFRVLLLLGIRPFTVATDAGLGVEEPADLMALVQGSLRVATQQQGQQGESSFSTSQDGSQLHSAQVLEQLVFEQVDSEGPTNKGFIKTVKPLILQLREKIKKDKKTWQGQLDDRAAAVKKCDVTFAKDTADMNSHHSNYLKRSTAHKECRAKQKRMYKEHKRCKSIQASGRERRKRQLKLLKKHKKLPNAKICKAQLGESYGEWLQRMADEFQARIKKYKVEKRSLKLLQKEMKKKSSSCSVKLAGYKKKVKTCNVIGEKMDGAKCRAALALQRACDRNKVCYNMAVKAYKTIEPTARLTETDMKVDWRSLARIQCYLGALGNGKAGSSNKKVLKQCKENKINTKHLDLNYPSLSKMKKCKSSDNYPCTKSYLEKEYNMLGKGPAKCTPCEGINDKEGDDKKNKKNGKSDKKVQKKKKKKIRKKDNKKLKKKDKVKGGDEDGDGDGDGDGL